MDHELEVAGLASAGALKSDTNPGEPPEQCRNCETPVNDEYCPQCGQLAADFHRPIWSLAKEGLADFFALDGRVSRTVPALLFRPGRVTRAYLDGKRARFVPPFRLFLLASLLFFSIAFTLGDQLGLRDGLFFTPNDDGSYDFHFGNGETVIEDTPGFLREDGSIDREALRESALDETDGMTEAEIRTTEVALERAANLYENQGEFVGAVEDWLPRVSLALFPVYSLALALLYAWHRKVYVYDHLITTLHFQSWLYMASAVAMIVAWFITPWAIAALFAAIPIYVYRTLRVVYGSGRVMAFIRMTLLLLSASVTLLTLLLAVMALGAFEASA